MSPSASRTRVTRFSLPAETSASSILRKFVREISQSTELTVEELRHLQRAVTDGFQDAVRQQSIPGEGRVVIRIDSCGTGVDVEMSYREVDFPPAEQFSRS